MSIPDLLDTQFAAIFGNLQYKKKKYWRRMKRLFNLISPVNSLTISNQRKKKKTSNALYPQDYEENVEKLTTLSFLFRSTDVAQKKLPTIASAKRRTISSGINCKVCSRPDIFENISFFWQHNTRNKESKIHHVFYYHVIF